MSFVAPLTEASKAFDHVGGLTRVTSNRRVNQSSPNYLLTRPGFIEVDAAGDKCVSGKLFDDKPADTARVQRLVRRRSNLKSNAPAHSSRAHIQATRKPAWLRGHVIQPGRSAERCELPRIQRPPSSRELNHATSPTRNCFASRAGDY